MTSVPRNGLLAEYIGTVDGGQLLDTSGNGRHGTIVGTVTSEAAGHPLGPAVVFSGAGGVTLPQAAMVAGAGARTVALWVYRATNAGSYETLYSAGATVTNQLFDITLGPGTVELVNYGNNDTISVSYAGAWQAVCFQYDGAVKRAWINGTQVLESAIMLATATAYHELAQRQGGQRFTGRLARVRIWDRALSEAEWLTVLGESPGLRGYRTEPLDLGPERRFFSAPLALGAGAVQSAHLALGVQGVRREATSLGMQVLRQAVNGLGLGAVRTAHVVLGAQALRHGLASLGGAVARHEGVDLSPGLRGYRSEWLELGGTGRHMLRHEALDIGGRTAVHRHEALDLSNPEVRVHQHDVRITLAGVDITSQVTSCSLSQSEDSLHDSLDMTVARERRGMDLLRLARVGAPVTVAVDGAVSTFILDDRTVEATGLRLTALSPSILADAPHADEVALNGPMLASTAATLLTTGADIDVAWLAHDWMLPADYSFSGLPLAGLAELAAACGAVVRASGDGLVVRPRYPTRPVYLHRANLAADYTRSDLLAVSVAETPGSGYRGVTVTGWSADAALPELEIMDPGAGQSGYALGDDVHVLAWWPGEALAVLAWVSDGAVQELGARIVTRTETMEVVGGHCETARPVHRLTSSMWIGQDHGPVAWKRGSRDIYTGLDRGLLEITYEARAVQYTLSGHDVSDLLFVLALDPGDAASATVWLSGGGDLDPEDLASELLTDRAAAVVRGMAWLDRTAYFVTAARLEAPYVAGVRDGVVVAVDDAEVGVSGRCHVAGVDTQITPGRIIQSLEVLQWDV